MQKYFEHGCGYNCNKEYIKISKKVLTCKCNEYIIKLTFKY